MVNWNPFIFMNTTIDFYPGVNGTLDANTDKMESFIFAIIRRLLLMVAVKYRHSHTLIPRSFSVNSCGV